MKRQDAFNIVWNHFVVNKGKPSVDRDSISCLYRGEAGAKCAIGVLLPDKNYEKSLEGEELEFVASLIPGLRVKENLGFLRQLQQAHDDASDKNDGIADAKYEIADVKTFRKNIKVKLTELAENWKLKIPA